MKKFFVVFFALLFCLSLGLAYADDTDARIIIRMSGVNRYETAVKASQIGWVDGSNYAIIVNGTNWADAISGIALSTALDAPILLTASGELGPLVKAELARLGVKNIVILGGTITVSTAIENQLKKNYATKRIFGDTRYETTIAITNEVYALTDFDSVVLVTGKKFPDGLSAGTYAAKGNIGILLSDRISLTDQ